MAEFRCKNCGNLFKKFIDKESDLNFVSCSICGSHWVERSFININNLYNGDRWLNEKDNERLNNPSRFIRSKVVKWN